MQVKNPCTSQGGLCLLCCNLLREVECVWLYPRFSEACVHTRTEKLAGKNEKIPQTRLFNVSTGNARWKLGLWLLSWGQTEAVVPCLVGNQPETIRFLWISSMWMDLIFCLKTLHRLLYLKICYVMLLSKGLRPFLTFNVLKCTRMLQH